MPYLMYYDDDRKKLAAQKIREGCAAYQKRFNHVPDLVLVNEVDMAVVSGIRVEPLARIRPNNFQIGRTIEEGRG